MRLRVTSTSVTVTITFCCSFTTSLGLDPSVTKVLGAMTDLSHALGLAVVAEGIESETGHGICRELGVRDGAAEEEQTSHCAMPTALPAASALQPLV